MVMARPAKKLSLVAQLDELARNGRILSKGVETEFERFVKYQEQWRQRWGNVMKEKENLADENNVLKYQKGVLEAKLKDVRAHLEQELKKRAFAEKQRDALDRQIQIVRELLNEKEGKGALDETERKKLEMLNTYQASLYDSPYNNLSVIEESGSLLDDDDDVSYDKTEDDLLSAQDISYLRSGRKWKRSLAPNEERNSHIRGESPELKKKRKSRSKTRHRRSNSASAVITSTTSSTPQNGAPDDISNFRRHHSGQSLDRLPMYNSLRRHNSGHSLDRPHVFMPKTSLNPGDSCTVCGKRIGFGAKVMKCKECGTITHESCKDDAPLPCAPTMQTPGKNIKSDLAFYAPADPPCIPALVVHCVKEVEKRGLQEQGLYRVPGSEKEVKKLKESFFKGKGAPNMTTIGDINVVCGCLKAFLKDLKEPLVTFELWGSFMRAAEEKDKDEGFSHMCQAVSLLPPANRDTLAYIVLHLHRIAESPETKMGIDNLSKVFGPTIVGYSTANPEPMKMIKETQTATLVVRQFMEVQQDYWQNFLNVPADVSVFPQSEYSRRTRTPDHYGFESMLGPLDGSGVTSNHQPWLTTPRSTKHLTAKGNYFASPVL